MHIARKRKKKVITHHSKGQKKYNLWIKYVELINDMYNNVVTSVRTSDGDMDDFPIRIGLHQGLALSPYLFALVMDEVTRDI